LRKEQYGDALDRYFRLGKNLNQRDTIAVRKMIDGYLKLIYPNGDFTKEDLEEIVKISLEMRRRVKEQLKKLGGMEFYDVNFSYIDNETFEEKYVAVPEQGGGKLIPDGMCNPGQVYTVSRGKSGMIGLFRLEGQMLPGNGKFERTGLGSDREAKEATNTAFNFLKANSNRISGTISTTTKDYIVNYQDLQGIGITGRLALPTLISLCSIALGHSTLANLAVIGDISISGTLIKVDELATDEEHALNTDEIVELLALRGINVSRKILVEDIKTLCAQGYEVLSYKKKYHYYYVVNRPLETAEVVMLADVINAAKITSAQKKELIERLSGTLCSHQAQSISKHIIALDKGRKGSSSFIYNVDAIERAINGDKQISFLYYDYNEKHKKAYRKDGAR
jgi:hypothetical protein